MGARALAAEPFYDKLLGEEIRTHRRHDLVEYFESFVPASKPEWWIRAGSLNSEDLSFTLGKWGSFKLPIPLGLMKLVASEKLHRAAAYKWLRPHEPCMGLSDLPSLRSQLGLASMSEQQFIEDLRQHCKEFQREHPKLRLWVENRLALLDCKDAPPDQMAQDHRTAAIGLRHGLIQSVNYLYSQPDMAAGLAEDLSSSALEAAARAVGLMFDKGQCSVSANLMVPMPLATADGPELADDNDSGGNRKTAATLWSELSGSPTCLVIVGETPKAGHTGFWIPLAMSAGNETLPGAPYAFQRMAPTAVFQRDLPDLSGFPASLDSKWKIYMATRFKESLFVSIPFKVPASPSVTTGTRVAAVLNVNASPAYPEGWYRAYHKEWLELASAPVAQFVEVAFYAYLIKISVQRILANTRIELTTGAGAWNSLPGLEVALQVRRLGEKR